MPKIVRVSGRESQKAVDERLALAGLPPSKKEKRKVKRPKGIMIPAEINEIEFPYPMPEEDKEVYDGLENQFKPIEEVEIPVVIQDLDLDTWERFRALALLKGKNEGRWLTALMKEQLDKVQSALQEE